MACLLLVAGPLLSAHGQQQGGGRHDALLSLVGLRVDELIARFGAPSAVHAVRGEEEWQDDVVFVYPQGNFFIHRDRVWQVGFNYVYGMRVGDHRDVAHLILGERAQNHGDFLLYPLQPPLGMGWPLAMRVNFNANRISAIFVYRPDF
ncbi:MAG: hypothetical protein FWD88_04765 [Treponema sp.]|nr:hypothetical protein [Treponema sp.]